MAEAQPGRPRAAWEVREGDVTMAVVVNGLVNSVTVIKAAARLLDGYWDRLTPAERAHMLQDITRHADLIAGVLADVGRELPEIPSEIIDLRPPLDDEREGA